MKARYWITAALCLATQAWGGPLASYTKDYDTRNWFGTVTHDYKTIGESSDWYGQFDFVVDDYALIDKFSLTLNYSATARQDKPKWESWKLYVQGWSNYGPTDSFELTPVVNDYDIATGVYSIEKRNESQARLFSTLIKDRYFSFWFEDRGTKNNAFLLYDAKLDIYEKAAEVVVPTTPTAPTGPAAPTNGVPEPASLALLGLGLAGLGGLRRGKPRV